jgi:hypothetical protein
MTRRVLTPRVNGGDNFVQIVKGFFSNNAKGEASSNLDTQGRRQQKGL